MPMENTPLQSMPLENKPLKSMPLKIMPLKTSAEQVECDEQNIAWETAHTFPTEVLYHQELPTTAPPLNNAYNIPTTLIQD